MAEDVYARFEGLEGESLDKKHLGSDGWVQLKSFSFGFGFPGTDGSDSKGRERSDLIKKLMKGDKTNKPLSHAEAVRKADETLKTKTDKDKGDKQWGHSGAMTFEPLSISKTVDIMSSELIKICHSGGAIPKVRVHMCRPAGDDPESKLAFLALTFEDVFIRSCDLTLATDGMPAEELKLEYKRVTIQSIWTDNAIGNRRPDQPMGSGWDLEKQEHIDIKEQLQ